MLILNIRILQGNVVTHLRSGGNICHTYKQNVLQNLTEILKIGTSQSYNR